MSPAGPRSRSRDAVPVARVVSQPIKRQAVTSKSSFIAIRSDERCHCRSRCPTPRAGPGEPGCSGEPRAAQVSPGCPGEPRAAQVSPAPAGERRRPRRHPVAGVQGGSSGRARPWRDPRAPSPPARGSARVQPSLLPSLRLIKIGLYAEHL